MASCANLFHDTIYSELPFFIRILVGGAGFEPAISCFRCRRDDLTSLPSETWSTVQALPLRSPDPVVVRRIITFPTADNSVDGAPGQTRTDTTFRPTPSEDAVATVTPRGHQQQRNLTTRPGGHIVIS
jgi:hypothetical protein